MQKFFVFFEEEDLLFDKWTPVELLLCLDSVAPLEFAS
jgi:hypothetical protein